MDATELARRVIETLDLQRRYFKGKSSADLEASKRLERALRRDCEAILAGPTLFDPAPAEKGV